jgi:hypothetical protein
MVTADPSTGGGHGVVNAEVCASYSPVDKVSTLASFGNLHFSVTSALWLCIDPSSND